MESSDFALGSIVFCGRYTTPLRKYFLGFPTTGGYFFGALMLRMQFLRVNRGTPNPKPQIVVSILLSSIPI